MTNLKRLSTRKMALLADNESFEHDMEIESINSLIELITHLEGLNLVVVEIPRDEVFRDEVYSFHEVTTKNGNNHLGQIGLSINSYYIAWNRR